jgi:hypothetical protein
LAGQIGDSRVSRQLTVVGLEHSGKASSNPFRAISVEGVLGTDAGNNKTIGPAGTFFASNDDV